MALLSSQLQPSLPYAGRGCQMRSSRRKPVCSAIAVDAPSPLAGVSGIRWGSSKLQGPRSEMEDDVVIRSEGLAGFSFAAVFDGHAGLSSVEFLRDELYKECLVTLQSGLLLTSKNYNRIKDAIQKAFKSVDMKLLSWLEQMGKDVDSGATATVMFIRDDLLIISHLGDSSGVISRTGKAEILTNPHRPYGNNKVSLEEVKRIRAAGGWIVDGRICGDISVSRAFGDMRFKTKKNEMLDKGVEEGRWTKKFISRIQFKDDLVTCLPDIYQVELGSDAEFILLASDGLWDYVKSSDAVNFVRNQLRQHGDVQLACEALAHKALDQRSQDNVSIVIADLGFELTKKAILQRSKRLYSLRSNRQTSNCRPNKISRTKWKKHISERGLLRRASQKVVTEQSTGGAHYLWSPTSVVHSSGFLTLIHMARV